MPVEHKMKYNGKVMTSVSILISKTTERIPTTFRIEDLN